MHVLLTVGALTEEGAFLQLPYFDPPLVEDTFRRLVSEEFVNSLLGWVESKAGARAPRPIRAPGS